jgi:hypothetical protein
VDQDNVDIGVGGDVAEPDGRLPYGPAFLFALGPYSIVRASSRLSQSATSVPIAPDSR